MKKEHVKYAKITSNDVLGILINTSLEISNPIGGLINLVNIASFLGTSRYQVKKCMVELVKNDVAEYDIATIYSEEETYPPYCGYRLSKVVRNYGKDYKGKADKEYLDKVISTYKEAEVKNFEIMKKCFNVV